METVLSYEFQKHKVFIFYHENNCGTVCVLIEIYKEKQHEKEKKDMGFVNEETSIGTMNSSQKKDWKYLNELGVRTMFGDPIGPAWSNLVVDREKNYYLISRGCTNPNRDNREIHYYVLCLDGDVLNMEVTKKESGNAREKSFECHWKIEKIEFPTGWSFTDISKDDLIDIICEAFTTEHYTKIVTPERTKALTVEILAPLEVNIEGDV